jgi:uncharacterized repeat protein (TIGR01451 family)
MNKLVLSALIFGAVGSVCAQKHSLGPVDFISSNNITQTTSVVDHPANSFIELDFSLTQGESWDTKDQANNMIVNCIDGTFITGFETSNIVIETVGRSYFSEAIVYFSDSQQGSNGIEFVVAAGNNNSGISSFSTNNILDITEFGRADVESLSDNKFYLQFYEATDDIPNGIDARFTGGKLKVWGVDLEATASCPFIAAVAEADISVEYNSDKNNGLFIGDHLVLEMTGTNNSADTAINVLVENSLSESLQFIDLSCDTGFSTSDANAAQSVVIGDVEANSSFVCTMSVEVLDLSDISASVNITSDNDSDSSNNSITLVIMAAAQSVPVSNWLMLSVLFLLLITSGLYFRKVH